MVCMILHNPRTSTLPAFVHIDTILVERVACTFFGEDPSFRLYDENVLKVISSNERRP